MESTLKKYEDLTTFKNDLESILVIETTEKLSKNNNIFDINKFIHSNTSSKKEDNV